MALNPTLLKDLMLIKVDAAVAANQTAGAAQRDAIFLGLAEAIIEHIQSAGVVVINLGSVAVGVTPGPASVPVTGTGAIT